MNKIFHSIADEAQFTREILGSGITQLGKANYGKRGMYFLAFTAISTGLERIGKLCLTLDFYIQNDGRFPDNQYLKNQIGHDLVKLYKKSQEIVSTYNFEFDYQDKIEDPIQLDILDILSKFAKGDRYANFDFLAGNSHQSDPIKSWSEKVDTQLFDKRVSQKKKDNIAYNAQLIDQLMGQFTIVRHYSENREDIRDVESASYRTGVYEATSKYRQLYVLQIVRYWVELSKCLQWKAMKLGREDIPFINEIFAIFYNSDSYFITRKTYDKN
ncbi:MAG: hypothetical protein KF732_07340 [Flavobacteriales bacterium]|nr:hypothetical protein [Flavobacteriales bacterium]